MEDVHATIAIPPPVETKPAMEWLLGGPVQKVSPRYAHALFQRLLAEHLGRWAEGRGRVGTEWRFWLAPAREYARYFVPDVAYLSYARLGASERDAAEEPRIAPDVAVEIRSPGDRNILILHKVDVYLRAGTTLVVLIDPVARTCVLHDAERETILSPHAILAHDALPGFVFDLGEAFAQLDA